MLQYSLLLIYLFFHSIDDKSMTKVVPIDASKIITYDGKPLNFQELDILKQLNTGHAFCLLKRKRLRGFCVKCIRSCQNPNYKKVLDKIDTYCPSCVSGPWICRKCFDEIH